MPAVLKNSSILRSEMRISKMKIILFIILFLFLVGFVWGAVYLKNVADYKQTVKETTFNEIGKEYYRKLKSYIFSLAGVVWGKCLLLP